MAGERGARRGACARLLWGLPAPEREPQDARLRVRARVRARACEHHGACGLVVLPSVTARSMGSGLTQVAPTLRTAGPTAGYAVHRLPRSTSAGGDRRGSYRGQMGRESRDRSPDPADITQTNPETCSRGTRNLSTAVPCLVSPKSVSLRFDSDYFHTVLALDFMYENSPAAANICCPWQIEAIGLPAEAKFLTKDSTRSSRARYSGARPPGITSPS